MDMIRQRRNIATMARSTPANSSATTRASLSTAKVLCVSQQPRYVLAWAGIDTRRYLHAGINTTATTEVSLACLKKSNQHTCTYLSFTTIIVTFTPFKKSSCCVQVSFSFHWCFSILLIFLIGLLVVTCRIVGSPSSPVKAVWIRVRSGNPTVDICVSKGLTSLLTQVLNHMTHYHSYSCL